MLHPDVGLLLTVPDGRRYNPIWWG